MTPGAAELDPTWLTDALRRSLGVDAAIVEVSHRSIGTGQVGENVRLALTWDDASPDLPTSVVAKLPSTSEVSRATAVQIDTYVKEVGFYRVVQREVDIRTPRLHALEWDPATHDFVLLMEDIAPATQGDQITGCSLDQAALAIDEAVGLHAPSWGRVGRWVAEEWLKRPGGDDATARAQLFSLLTGGFVERYEGRLTASQLAMTTSLTEVFPAWQHLLIDWADRHGWCLVHGDYRLDNMLFGEPPVSPALTIVDWQTVAIGVGPTDVAYFLGAGLLPPEREANERDLVGRYAAQLRSRGLGLDDDEVWEAYVLGSVTGLYMAVLASQIVERTERGDEMFAVMAERHLAQVEHVGLAERLGVA